MSLGTWLRCCTAILLACQGYGLLVAEQADSELLQTAIEEDRLQEAITRTEVSQALNDARKTPRALNGIEQLKNLRESIIQAPSLSAEVRAELLDRIGLGLRELSRRRIEKDRLDDAARSNLAELDARRQSLSASVRQNDIVEGYVDHVNALLDERRFDLANDVAQQLQETAPRRVAPVVTLTKVEQVGARERAMDLGELKSRRFTDTLYQVELSHVPVPDDPPITYMRRDKWRALTERRKARYSNPDLTRNGPAEKRIALALQSMATVDFQEEPLSNALSVLEERHGVPIEIDVRALEDENIDTSDTVTIDVSNVSLRSALRMMLHQLDLTYVVENEVLMITSKSIAEKMVVTRVYPVADLVVPVNSLISGLGTGFGGGIGNGTAGFQGPGAQGGIGAGGGFGQGAGFGNREGGFGQGAGVGGRNGGIF